MVVGMQHQQQQPHASPATVLEDATTPCAVSPLTVPSTIATVNGGDTSDSSEGCPSTVAVSVPIPVTGSVAKSAMANAMYSNGRVKLRDVNPHLVCVLCHGYFVDATSIAECLHSFCRSCIILYLETKNYCPICEVQINNSKPHLSLKPDKTLQDIVYKLVPGLFYAEMKRRNQFYQDHPNRDLHLHPEFRGVHVDRLVYSPQDDICVSLEYYDKSKEEEEWETVGSHRVDYKSKKKIDSSPDNNNVPKKHFLCTATVRVTYLKKLIKLKYNLETEHKVELYYRRESLPDDYSLMDIAYIYAWKRNSPMRLYFRINIPAMVAESMDKLTSTRVPDETSSQLSPCAVATADRDDKIDERNGNETVERSQAEIVALPKPERETIPSTEDVKSPSNEPPVNVELGISQVAASPTVSKTPVTSTPSTVTKTKVNCVASANATTLNSTTKVAAKLKNAQEKKEPVKSKSKVTMPSLKPLNAEKSKTPIKSYLSISSILNDIEKPDGKKPAAPTKHQRKPEELRKTPTRDLTVTETLPEVTASAPVSSPVPPKSPVEKAIASVNDTTAVVAATKTVTVAASTQPATTKTETTNMANAAVINAAKTLITLSNSIPVVSLDNDTKPDINPGPVPSNGSAPSSTPAKALTSASTPTREAMPVSAPARASTPVSAPSRASTPVSAPTRASTPVNTPSRVSTPVNTPAKASTPISSKTATSASTRAPTPVSSKTTTSASTRPPTPVSSRAQTPISTRASTPVSSSSLQSKTSTSASPSLQTKASTPMSSRASTPVPNGISVRASTPISISNATSKTTIPTLSSSPTTVNAIKTMPAVTPIISKASSCSGKSATTLAKSLSIPSSTSITVSTKSFTVPSSVPPLITLASTSSTTSSTYATASSQYILSNTKIPSSLEISLTSSKEAGKSSPVISLQKMVQQNFTNGNNVASVNGKAKPEDNLKAPTKRSANEDKKPGEPEKKICRQNSELSVSTNGSTGTTTTKKIFSANILPEVSITLNPHPEQNKRITPETSYDVSCFKPKDANGVPPLTPINAAPVCKNIQNSPIKNLNKKLGPVRVLRNATLSSKNRPKLDKQAGEPEPKKPRLENGVSSVTVAKPESNGEAKSPSKTPSEPKPSPPVKKEARHQGIPKLIDINAAPYSKLMAQNAKARLQYLNSLYIKTPPQGTVANSEDALDLSSPSGKSPTSDKSDPSPDKKKLIQSVPPLMIPVTMSKNDSKSGPLNKTSPNALPKIERKPSPIAKMDKSPIRKPEFRLDNGSPSPKASKSSPQDKSPSTPVAKSYSPIFSKAMSPIGSLRYSPPELFSNAASINFLRQQRELQRFLMPPLNGLTRETVTAKMYEDWIMKAFQYGALPSHPLMHPAIAKPPSASPESTFRFKK